jgi:zinc protease
MCRWGERRYDCQQKGKYMKTNKLTKLILSILIVSVVAFLHARFDLADPIPVDPDLLWGQLDNGLTYYVKQNSEPSGFAYFMLVVNVGSSSEDDDQLGIAHFLEHSAFNGTENFPGNSMREYMDSLGFGLGMGFNAGTSHDFTLYMLQARSTVEEQMNNAFLILRDWSDRIVFDNEAIDKERGIIIEEGRGRRGAQDRTMNEMLRVSYAGSPYANRMPIGCPDIIANFDYPVLARFYEDWYRPDLMAVIVVGDIDKQEMKDQIFNHFNDMQPRANPRPLVDLSVPFHDETRFAVITDPEATRTSISITIKHPLLREDTIENARKFLMEMLFSMMLNNRFAEISRQADPPFLSAHSRAGFTIAGSIEEFSLMATVDETKIVEAFRTLITEIERVKHYGFYQSELSRAKNQLILYFENAAKEKDTAHSGQLIYEYFQHFSFDLMIALPDPVTLLELAHFLNETISLSDMETLAWDLWTDENRVVTITAPAPVDVDLSREFTTRDTMPSTDDATSPSGETTIAVGSADSSRDLSVPNRPDIVFPTEYEITDLFVEIESTDIGPWTELVIDENLLSRLPRRVKVSKPKFDKQLQIYTWRLKNGATVRLRTTDFKNDEIIFSAFRRGGATVAEDDIFHGAFRSDMIQAESGVGEFNRTQLEAFLSGKMASVSMSIENTRESIDGDSSVRDFETAMQLLYLHFTEPRFDERAFATWKNRNEISIRNRHRSPETAFRDEATRILTNDHFRSRPMDLDALEAIDHRAAFDFYRSRFSSVGDFNFTFVGNINHRELHKFIEQYIAPLPRGNVSSRVVDRGMRFNMEPVRSHVYRGIDDKTSVRLIFPSTFVRSFNEQQAVTALSMTLTFMLLEMVREEASGVYVIQAMPQIENEPFPQLAINVFFDCDPERVDELIGIVEEQIRSIMDNTFDVKFLDNFREGYKNQIEQMIRSNHLWASLIESYFGSGLMKPNDLINFVNSLDHFTAEDIARSARKYIDFDKMTTVILFPDPDIEREEEE